MPETRDGHARPSRPPRSTSRCGAGSIPPRSAGIPAIITSTRPGAATTRARPKACGPEDMMRHVLGEALSVGSVLNWGPSYYHQRQFFEGEGQPLSTPSTLLRYDLEVSGFPSSHCGHLVLLRLREQDYPDARQIEDWPSGICRSSSGAKAQGAVTGFAHPGIGLQVQVQRAAQLRDAAVRRDRRQRIHRGRHPRRRWISSRRWTRRSSRS